jgi:hypothetical protein
MYVLVMLRTSDVLTYEDCTPNSVLWGDILGCTPTFLAEGSHQGRKARALVVVALLPLLAGHRVKNLEEREISVKIETAEEGKYVQYSVRWPSHRTRVHEQPWSRHVLGLWWSSQRCL